jgi:hypothetical protein
MMLQSSIPQLKLYTKTPGVLKDQTTGTETPGGRQQ